MRDPLDYDPLREKFDELEREVRQRDCPHRSTIPMTVFGERPYWICQDCGKKLDAP